MEIDYVETHQRKLMIYHQLKISHVDHIIQYCWILTEIVGRSGQIRMGSWVKEIFLTEQHQQNSISCQTHSTILTDISGDLSFGNTTCIPEIIGELPRIKKSFSGSHHSMLLNINDRLWAFGFNEYGQLGLDDEKSFRYYMRDPEMLQGDYCRVICFGRSSILINSDGQCFASGSNKWAALGFGTIESVHPPTKIDILVNNIDNGRFYKTKSARKFTED